MPVRCLACFNDEVAGFVRRRTLEGATVRTICRELTDPERKLAMGYRRPPTPTAVHEHLSKHVRAVAPVSAVLPSFTDPEVEREEDALRDEPSDVAGLIQKRSLEALRKGEMPLTASHALRAQEILDRRAEKQRDRELMLVLARVLTREKAPPPKYVGMSEASASVPSEPLVIEGVLAKEPEVPSPT